MISRVILVILGILLGLLIAEATVRYFKLAPAVVDKIMFGIHKFDSNPKICYKIRPYAYEEINAEGFRDDEFRLKKEAGTIRIIMLGDSITFGYRVSSHETFTSILEGALSASPRSLADAKRYDVMNFGVGGYNIVSEVAIFEEIGLKYRPDIVVLNYFFNDNDVYPFVYRRYMERKNGSLVKKNFVYEYYMDPDGSNWRRAFFRSHLFIYVWAVANEWGGVFRKSFDNANFQFRKDVVREKLQELKKMVDEQGGKLVICAHPTLDYAKRAPHPNYARTKAVADELEVPWIDLLPYYQQASSDPKTFVAVEGDLAHPNAKGHRLVAQVLLLHLKQFGLLGQI